MESNEAIFARMCDKLEADIQSKLYCEENSINIDNKKNAHLLEDERIKILMSNGEKTIADLFIENDRPLLVEKEFQEILDFVKKSDLLKMKER